MPQPIGSARFRAARVVSIVIAAVIIGMFSACSTSDGRSNVRRLPHGGPGNIELPVTRAATAGYLYNRFNQRLLSYDFWTNEIEVESDADNYFQYEFPTPSTLYTAGNSLTNAFKIIRVGDRDITTVLSVDANQGIFPLATDGRRHFFTVSDYRANGDEAARQVVELQGRKLIPRPNATGLVDAGAILEGALYYTRYNTSEDDYSAFKVDMEDVNARPQLVRTGLSSGRIYAHKGQLWFSDKNSVFRGGKHLPCADLCYFVDRLDLLAHIRVGTESDLVLDIFDVPTGTRITSITGVVDFRLRPASLVVYLQGGKRVLRARR